MRKRTIIAHMAAALLGLSCALGVAAPPAAAQSRIKTLPGYETWAKMAPQIPRSVEMGGINADWAENSTYFDYSLDGRRWRFDTATKTTSPAPPREPTDEPARPAAAPSPGGLLLARGRGREADALS